QARRRRLDSDADWRMLAKRQGFAELEYAVLVYSVNDDGHQVDLRESRVGSTQLYSIEQGCETKAAGGVLATKQALNGRFSNHGGRPSRLWRSTRRDSAIAAKPAWFASRISPCIVHVPMYTILIDEVVFHSRGPVVRQQTAVGRWALRAAVQLMSTPCSPRRRPVRRPTELAGQLTLSC